MATPTLTQARCTELCAGGRVGLADAGPACENTLLFLRRPMRHPAQGKGQQSRRVRAVGGIPGQSRQALSQRRETLPAERASRPPVVAPDPRGKWFPQGRLGRSARPDGGGYPRDSTSARERQLRVPRRGVDEEREGVSQRQVRG